MGKTRKLAAMALLTAIALTVFVIENQIPAPVPIPGVKLGLANIVTLVAMVLLSRRDAGIVLLVRILMGAMFAGSPSTLLFSAAGGALAYAVMCLTVGLFPGKQRSLFLPGGRSAVRSAPDGRSGLQSPAHRSARCGFPCFPR